MSASLETATMSSKLSTRFTFTSPLKVAQNSSHDCNGNGNRDDNYDRDPDNDSDDHDDGMSIFSPPLYRLHSFRQHLNKLQRGVDIQAHPV